MKIMKYKNIRKGFTLIELLVVISIIGVLSSIILVNLNNSRARTKEVKFIVEIEELRKALFMYSMDNGHYPDSSMVSGNMIDISNKNSADYTVFSNEMDGYISVPESPNNYYWHYDSQSGLSNYTYCTPDNNNNSDYAIVFETKFKKIDKYYKFTSGDRHFHCIRSY